MANKEFDKEIATKIYKYLKENHQVEQRPLFTSILNSSNCWEQVYKLELFEQFLFIRYYIDKSISILLDDKDYLDWIDKYMSYLYYDPRPKMIQKISQYYHSTKSHIKYNLLGKFWWKLLYWKIRYGSKWKYIKMNSKWNNPI